ncbi:MAG: ABC transporter substrate-binding protein [Cypionkella sp.]
MINKNLRALAAMLLATALSAAAIPAYAQPVEGGQLVAAVDVEPASLDPIFGNAPGADGNIFNLMYERLIEIAPDGTVSGKLAESFEIAEDQLSITFKLRPGVVFHDGTPLDAEAVRFSLARVIDPQNNSTRRIDLAAITAVEVIDSMTVKVSLSSPSGAVLASLANDGGSIVSPTAVGTLGADFARNPVGTGPFKFVDWKGGDSIAVEAFEDYWDKDAEGRDLPYLDGVTMRFISNTAVKILEARAGTVQLANSLQVKDFEALQSETSLQLLDTPIFTHQWMAFNTTKPPFDNEVLRRAVLTAIDRNALEKVVSRGFGVVTPTLVPPTEWIYDESLEYPAYDPEEARSLLGESGFDDTFTLSIIQRDPDTQIAQMVQAMLTQAGFKVEIEVMERQAWLDKVVTAKAHDAALLRISVPRPDPSLVFGDMGPNGANFAGYQNEEFFGAIDAAALTFDREERRAGYIQIQQMLLDELPYGFFFHWPSKDVASNSLQGLERIGSGAWVLTRATLASQ